MTAARYAPVITEDGSADWRALVSTLRAVKDAPLYASGSALFRSSLYWADALTAALANTTASGTPAYNVALASLADPDLFDNPDKAALAGRLSGHVSRLSRLQTQFSGRHFGFQRLFQNARSRLSLSDTYTLTGGASADDRKKAEAYFSSQMAELSALKTDSERISYIYLLFAAQYQTGGERLWTAAYGRKSRSAPPRSRPPQTGCSPKPASRVSRTELVGCVERGLCQWPMGGVRFYQGSTLRSLDDYRLIDTHPGSTLMLTQVMRPGSSYYNAKTATVDKYFSYTSLTGTPQATAAQMQAYIKKPIPTSPSL